MSCVDMPLSVKVGALRYTIYCTKAKHDEATADAQEPIMGVTDTDKLTISIRPHAPHALKQQTLLHEVLHTLTHHVGIHADLGEKKEESLVSRLAPALLTFLLDNPEVLTYLVGRDPNEGGTQ